MEIANFVLTDILSIEKENELVELLEKHKP